MKISNLLSESAHQISFKEIAEISDQLNDSIVKLLNEKIPKAAKLVKQERVSLGEIRLLFSDSFIDYYFFIANSPAMTEITSAAFSAYVNESRLIKHGENKLSELFELSDGMIVNMHIQSKHIDTDTGAKDFEYKISKMLDTQVPRALECKNWIFDVLVEHGTDLKFIHMYSQVADSFVFIPAGGFLLQNPLNKDPEQQVF